MRIIGKGRTAIYLKRVPMLKNSAEARILAFVDIQTAIKTKKAGITSYFPTTLQIIRGKRLHLDVIEIPMEKCLVIPVFH